MSKLNAFSSLSLFLPLVSSLSTTALASIFAPLERCFKRPPPDKLFANPNSTLPAPFHAPCPSCPLVLVVRLRLRASVLSALRPGRDAHTPTARRARRRRLPRHALVRCRGVRPPARPASPPRAAAGPPPRARALLSLHAPCTLLAPPSAPVLRGTLSSACTLPPPGACQCRSAAAPFAYQSSAAGLQLARPPSSAPLPGACAPAAARRSCNTLAWAPAARSAPAAALVGASANLTRAPSLFLPSGASTTA